MLIKVISGGQTGADRIGLETAKSRLIKTGGTAPKDFMTEKGPDYTLRDEFGLVEAPVAGYPWRTRKNVLDSDGTVLFGNMTSSGSFETIQHCVKMSKPHKTNPIPEELAKWIEDKNIRILNVAGNRGSKLNTLKQIDIRDVLLETFTLLGYK